ncbi:MAG: hypothetical protein R3335_13715, partial [Anaerolineales bacterium]|nr:hypothetical protein [Anaerolineales bacterium]
MLKILMVLGTLLVFVLISIVALKLLTPWMDRWGAAHEEISAELPGDALVPAPARLINRAITIRAAPEEIYPWIVQLGA